LFLHAVHEVVRPGICCMVDVRVYRNLLSYQEFSKLSTAGDKRVDNFETTASDPHLLTLGHHRSASIGISPRINCVHTCV